MPPTTAEEPTATLIRLEQRFDGHLARRLGDVPNTLEALPTADELESLLGPRTVLMSHYVGRAIDGQLALYTLLQTSEQAFGTFGILRVPATSSARLSPDGHTVETEFNLFGPLVAQLRQDIVAEPGPAVVASEAADTLERDHAFLLGGEIQGCLSALRASGKDHLCIHSHSAFHFYPLHLLGRDGGCLADDWTVTYIPHPSLLRRRSRSVLEGTRHTVAALGLSFGDGAGRGLDPLPGAAEEAEIVARLLGGHCWTNSAATKQRLVEALTSARRVHVATHGRHRVAAPAFQHLYLHPDHASDGVLYAYELIGLDLRHLELVTLSACETSLGRMDIGSRCAACPRVSSSQASRPSP